MSTRNTSIAQLILLSGALLVATAALASLKGKPPKGVELNGEWQLDPYRSDDPTAVIDEAREDMRESMGHRGGMGGGMGGGGPGRRGGGMGGGGFPGGGGGGFGGHHRSGASQDEGASGSPSRGTGSQLFNDLSKNPEKLTFEKKSDNLRVSTEQSTVECAAGVKVAISDALGDGERECGWDGRAWVVETTRGKNFDRTDRYELSKDGKTLSYLTTITGSRISKIKISRVYVVTPAT